MTTPATTSALHPREVPSEDPNKSAYVAPLAVAPHCWGRPPRMNSSIDPRSPTSGRSTNTEPHVPPPPTSRKTRNFELKASTECRNIKSLTKNDRRARNPSVPKMRRNYRQLNKEPNWNSDPDNIRPFIIHTELLCEQRHNERIELDPEVMSVTQPPIPKTYHPKHPIRVKPHIHPKKKTPKDRLERKRKNKTPIDSQPRNNDLKQSINDARHTSHPLSGQY